MIKMKRLYISHMMVYLQQCNLENFWFDRKDVEIFKDFRVYFRVPNPTSGNNSSLQVGDLSVGASALYSRFYFHFPIVVQKRISNIFRSWIQCYDEGNQSLVVYIPHWYFWINYKPWYL